MKTSLHLTKATIAIATLLFGMSFASFATAFTAATSGNWSNATTWGGSGPGFNITGADNVTIPEGITVTLDNSLIINNASSSLTVAGSLTGVTDITISAGALSGTGVVSLNSLNIGSVGFINSVGPISVYRFSNSQPVLALGTTINVSDTVIFNSGVVELNTGGAIDLANNATINMAGGLYKILGGQLNFAGKYNVLYTGAVSKVGGETSFAGLQNVTVSLISPSNQLSLTGNLAVAGILSLQQGVFSLNGNSLTVNGNINTSVTGSVLGNAASNITINGTGSAQTIAFAPVNQTLNNLTVNIGSGGSVALASNVTVAGALSLNAGSLILNGNGLTIDGTVGTQATGSIISNSNSAITMNGSGNAGALIFNPSADTLGSLTVNMNSAGSVLLGSALVLSGTPALTLSGGSLNLNGQSLTIGGAVLTQGSGTISGSSTSNLAFTGSGGTGTLAFTPGNQIINNLTIDIAFSGAVFVNSDLSIVGALTLTSGEIGIGDNNLTVTGNGSIQGGSPASYIITNGTGSLIMPIANAGAALMFPVGNQESYAPVIVTNNSTAPGNFGVYTNQGVFASGTTGTDLSIHQAMVNTFWDVSSSLTSGANVNLEMFWNSGMEVNGFDNTQDYISHYTEGAWDTSAFTAATVLTDGSFSLALTGVTSFSQFAVFDKNTTTSTTTAIQDVTSDISFSLYPNPASDQINISVQDPGNFLTMKIYDALGNEIVSEPIVNSVTALDISNLTPGVYFASFNNSVTKKFIKL